MPNPHSQPNENRISIFFCPHHKKRRKKLFVSYSQLIQSIYKSIKPNIHLFKKKKVYFDVFIHFFLSFFRYFFFSIANIIYVHFAPEEHTSSSIQYRETSQRNAPFPFFSCWEISFPFTRPSNSCVFCSWDLTWYFRWVTHISTLDFEIKSQMLLWSGCCFF